MAILGIEREMVQPQTQPAQRTPAPVPQRKGKDPRRILAEQQANRAREFDDLNAKMLRSPMIARAEGLIPAAVLGPLGFDVSTTGQGMAYGIDPMSLTPQQQALMDTLMQRGRR